MFACVHLVEESVAETLNEALSGHQLEMADVGGNGGDKLVIENNDLGRVLDLTLTNNVLTKSHGSWIVVWCGDFRDSNLEDVSEVSL